MLVPCLCALFLVLVVGKVCKEKEESMLLRGICLYFVKAPPRHNFYSAKRLGEDGCNIFASPLSSEGCLVFPDLQQYPIDR